MTELEQIKEELWNVWLVVYYPRPESHSLRESYISSQKQEFFSDLDRLVEAAIKELFGVKGSSASIDFVGIKKEAHFVKGEI